MSGMLFKFKPEELDIRAKREREQQSMALRLVAEALVKPGLTLAEMAELIECEMPAVRTGLAVARNYMVEASRQRDALVPAMELFAARVGDRNDGDDLADLNDDGEVQS